MAVTTEMQTQVEQLYVALFGRAPDSSGMSYWTQELSSGTSLVQVANEMYNTPQAAAYYPGYFTPTQTITSFYENVLGRAPDATGLAYWVAELNATNPGQTIIDMINAVEAYSGTDPAALQSQTLFNNKVAVAAAYLAQNGSVADAAAVIAAVPNANTPLTPDQVAALIADATTPGTAYTLTTGPDHITIGGGTTNIVSGTVNGNPTAAETPQTLSVGDVVAGNGNTILNLAISGTGNAAVVTLSNLSKINIVSTASGTLHANAIDWTSVGSINLTTGGDLDVIVKNLQVGTGLSVGSHATGTVQAYYTNHNHDGVFNNGSDPSASGMGSVSFVGNNVNATGSGHGTSESMGFFAHATRSNTAVTIGNVTVTGAGNQTGFSLNIGNSHSSGTAFAQSGNVTVGNVSITGVADLDAHIGLRAVDMANIVLGNVSVGNVTLDLGANATGNFDVTSYASGGSYGNYNGHSGSGYSAVVGNVSVGDISVNLGASATLSDFRVGAEAQAYANNAGSATVTAMVGNVTVGNVDLTLGAKAAMELAVYASAYAGAYDASSAVTATATVGNVSVGNVTATLDNSASLDIDTYAGAGAYASGGGNAAAQVGTVTVGTITIGAGNHATVTVTAGNYANAYYGYGVGSVSATAGDVTVGAVSITGGTHDSLNLDIYSGAYVAPGYGSGGTATHEAATAGNVTVGTITLGAGDHSTVSVTVDSHAAAYNGYGHTAAAVATAGNVSVGNVSITGGTHDVLKLDIYSSGYAGYGYSAPASAAAAVGNVSVGNVSVSVAKSSTLDLHIGARAQAYASHSGTAAVATAGSVTVGDITITEGPSAKVVAQVYDRATASNSATTAAASVGDVSVGTVTINVASGARHFNTGGGSAADFLYVYADGGIGNISVAGINYVGGKSASTDIRSYVHADNSGSIASYSVGNVNATVGNLGHLIISNELYVGDGNIGDVTLGKLTVNLGTGATFDKTGANTYLHVSADYGSIGNVKLGGVAIVAATGANADVTNHIYAYGSASHPGGIASFSQGNINLNIAKHGSLSASTNLYATGNIGNVKVGNVTLSAGKSATAHHYLKVEAQLSSAANAGDIGTTTVGNVSVSALGAGAQATERVFIASSGDGATGYGHNVGAVTVGNLGLNASGAAAVAQAEYIVGTKAAGTVGALSVGNVTLTVNNGAHANLTLVDAKGDITVGNVSISTTTTFTASNHVAVHLAGMSGGNIVIGNVTVSGGNGTGDNFGSLAGMVSGSITGSGSLTLGNIDYSAYGGSATIDLTNGASGIHDYKGASSIIGSAQADAITVGIGAANDGMHTITGGGGGDTYNFNDNMTATQTGVVADAIVGFNYLNDTINVGTYTNGIHSDLSAGLTVAQLQSAATGNGANSVTVGLVGGNVDMAYYDGSHVYVIQLTGTTNINNVLAAHIV